MIHLRKTQHWTWCWEKVRTLPERHEVRDVAEVVRPENVLALRKGLTAEPKDSPTAVCRGCYRAWRNSRTRRR